MAKIISVVNQKGGVGKTTTCVNLPAALQALGKKVLVCDFDPQANATSGFGIDKNAVNPNIYQVLIGDAECGKAIQSTKYLDVLPASKDLAGAGIELYSLDNPQFRLRDALRTVADRYDYIFIDCPPSLEMLTVNALCASDTVLVPVQCEYYALEGLSDLMNTIKRIRKKLNPSLDIEGILLTMYDARTNLSMQVAEEVKRHFHNRVFFSTIPRNVRLSEAPSHGKPILAYDNLCAGAQAYHKLAEEFIEKQK